MTPSLAQASRSSRRFGIEKTVIDLSEEQKRRDSFRKFYDRVSPALWGYIFRVCNNAALADDIFQESFLKFLRMVQWNMHERQQQAFVYKIAARLIIDNFRRIKPEPLDPGEKSGETGSALISHHGYLEPDMKKTFDSLKPRDRSLLWLAYVEGYSHGEIAEMMGLSSKSIKVLLFRLRGSFAAELRRKGYSPEEQ
jgi:RNA polymerase sigma-70 factor (ECF subfamily)